MGDIVDFEKYKKDKLKQARQNDTNHSSDKENKPESRLSRYKKKLNKARETRKKAKATISLPKQIEFSNDWPMLFPIFFAAIKDFLDWLGFSLPGLNESLNLSVMGLSSLVLILISSSSKNRKRAKKGVRHMLKWFTMLTGTTAEEFFGINFLPIETITVIVAYIFVLYERAGNEIAEKERGENEEGDEDGGEKVAAAA